MATITRTKETAVATVSSAARKISVSVPERLTVEESKELRKLLKKEEEIAVKQSSSSFAWGFDVTNPRGYFLR